MKIGKIIACLLAPVTLISACNVMETNAAETDDENSEAWAEYALAVTAEILANPNMTQADAILYGVEIAIANTIPLATASDVSVFDGISHVIGEYYYESGGSTTYHVCHIGGNKRLGYSDALYQLDLLQYPNGSKAYYIFTENGNCYLDPMATKINVTGSNVSSAGYTEPNAVVVTSNKLPFSIYYRATGANPVTKNSANTYSQGVLCSYIAGAFGHDFETNFNNNLGTDSGFLFPSYADSGANTVNEYLSVVYDQYETDYGIPFEYTFPDILPTGVLLPDGTISGEQETTDESGNININVEIEFPTVPNVLEPTYFDYDTLQTEVIENPDDSVIKDSWLEGFGALVTSMVYTMTSFRVDGLIILLSVFCLVLILVKRW